MPSLHSTRAHPDPVDGARRPTPKLPPRAAASCTPIWPTPPVAPRTATLSPFSMPASRNARAAV